MIDKITASLLFSLLMLLGLSAPVIAADEKTVSLSDCITITLRENRTIKNAYLDRVVQKYDLRVAEDKFTPKLLLTPEIQATGSTTDRSKTATATAAGTITELLPTGASINLGANHITSSTETATPSRTYGWNVTLTQPLLKGGGLDVGLASVRTARLSEQTNILSLKSTLISTLTSVISAYRSYVQAIKSLEITRQSLDRSKELLATNRELIAAGRMAAIEIVQSEADVAGKEFSLLSGENAVDAARLALTKAMDVDKRTMIRPLPETNIPALPYSYDQAVKLAFENRPDYLSSLLGYESAKINLATAKNSTLWDLSLTGGYGQNYTLPASGAKETYLSTWNAGLKLTIPIGDLSIQQQFIAADIGLKKLENDLTVQRRNIEIEVQDAVRGAEMNLRQIKLATLSRTLSEKKVEIETEKLKVGRSTNFQLVSYQNDLVNAQNSELGAINDYLNALTSLYQTLGLTLDHWRVSLEERKD
jgi:outer membrane protein TolC